MQALSEPTTLLGSVPASDGFSLGQPVRHATCSVLDSQASRDMLVSLDDLGVS